MKIITGQFGRLRGRADAARRINRRGDGPLRALVPNGSSAPSRTPGLLQRLVWEC
jgi:hypothetical protein